LITDLLTYNLMLNYVRELTLVDIRTPNTLFHVKLYT